MRYRRAMVPPTPADGSAVPMIARLVAADEDTSHEVVHHFDGSPVHPSNTVSASSSGNPDPSGKYGTQAMLCSRQRPSTGSDERSTRL